MGRPLKIAKSSTSGTGFPQTASGVVGGNTGISGSQVLARVKIGSQAEGNGYIIRQKGKRKYLVANASAIQDEDIVANASYIITSVSNTDWSFFGVKNADVGTIFTSPVNGTGLTTNGVVNRVGVCSLANTSNSSLANDTMTVTCTFANSATFRAATLTNHFVTSFADVKYVADDTANAGTTPVTVQVALS